MQESTKVLLDWSLLKELRGKIRQYGLRFPYLASKWLFYRIGNVVQDANFDAKYDVNTAFVVAADALDFNDAERQAQAVRYRPTPPFTIRRALRVLQRRTAINFAESTFIDYGCGAGRVLFIASLAGFKKVIGVELSPALVATCDLNITSFKKKTRCGEIHVKREDAAKFEPNSNANVFFFFVPFDRDIYEAVMVQIRESAEQNPRPIYILDIGSKLKSFSFIDEGCELICVVEKLSIFEYPQIAVQNVHRHSAAITAPVSDAGMAPS